MSEIPDDVREAINRTPIAFWTCLNHDHKDVTWNGDVAVCDTCGLTSEMTQRLIRSVRKHAAEHVLKVSEIRLGYRCPACHGRPAVDRWRSRAKRRYVCGCGHQWDLPTRSAQHRAAYDASPSALLTAMAESGEMPLMPARVPRSPAGGSVGVSRPAGASGGAGEAQEDPQ